MILSLSILSRSVFLVTEIVARAVSRQLVAVSQNDLSSPWRWFWDFGIGVDW
jgi:hypothetical protein